jgi:pantoate--beta-alanine ligase
MLIARTLDELRRHCATLRERFGSLGLVPTMGALHDGHMALVGAAAAGRAGTVAAHRTGVVTAGGAGIVTASRAGIVTSIFVNPLQFSPTEDLTRYPRDEAGDLARLEAHGCDLAWLPDVATMYPPADATTISVEGPALRWEGDARPGHFRGVATVCAKLFGQVRPDRAYFGEKDWQQLQVVTRMVADLRLPLEIVGVPTVREPDGLALSSRNRFILPDERGTAARLFEVLQATARRLSPGSVADPALDEARKSLVGAGFAVDYVALVDGPSLDKLPAARPPARLIAAARLGSVRLIDNVPV